MTRKRKSASAEAPKAKASKTENLTAKESAPAALDCNFYPHILDTIIDLAPRNSLLRLRATCSEIRDRVDAILAEHICIHNGFMRMGRRTTVEFSTHGPKGIPQILPFMRGWWGEFMNENEDCWSDNWDWEEPKPGSGDNDDYRLNTPWFINPSFHALPGEQNPFAKRGNPWYDPDVNPKHAIDPNMTTALPPHAVEALANTRVIDIMGCVPALGVDKATRAATRLETARFFVALAPLNNPRVPNATPIAPKKLIHFTYLDPPKLGPVDRLGEPTSRMRRRNRITPLGPVADGVEHVTVTVRFWAANPLLPGGAVIIPRMPDSVEKVVLILVPTKGEPKRKTRSRRSSANYQLASAADLPPAPGILKSFVQQLAFLSAAMNPEEFDIPRGDVWRCKRTPDFVVVGAEKVPARALGVDDEGTLRIEDVDHLLRTELESALERELKESDPVFKLMTTEDYRNSISWEDAQLQFNDNDILRFAH